MTRPELVTQIQQLESKAEEAAERGDLDREYQYLDRAEELEGTLSAMGGE